MKLDRRGLTCRPFSFVEIPRHSPDREQCLKKTTTEREGARVAQTFRVYGPGDIGVAVRHVRLQAGLSQARLAELNGAHRS